ncbi:MAG TPA: aquaporin [Xanthomonadales bacterium]|nr:aquaporin [Xanthomonadales bacterium]
MSRGGRLSRITPQQRAKLERERRKHRERDWRRHVACYTAEFVGTLIVTLGSFGPLAIQDGLGLHLGYVVVAGSTGIATMVVIYALGQVSGAHTNPITTIAFALRGDFDWSRVPGYVAVQFLGALAAGALVLGILHPDRSALHAKLALGPWPAFWLEIVLTAILVLVAISTAKQARFLGPQTAFANGATTVFDRLVGYHISTASMNPARTLGPALLLGGTQDWWVFTFGPLIGAVIAVALLHLIQGGPNESEAERSAGVEGD